MKKDTVFTLLIIVCSLVQVGLSSVLLNSLSTIDNWSAVYAEDSGGYLLAADNAFNKIAQSIQEGDLTQKLAGEPSRVEFKRLT